MSFLCLLCDRLLVVTLQDWGASLPPERCPEPSAALYYPSGTDYTMQAGDHWFYTATDPLRTLDELIYTYHQTVGHNTNLELDFAIDRHGLLREDHAAFYKRFGDWIRTCYGSRKFSSELPVLVADGAISTESFVHCLLHCFDHL